MHVSTVCSETKRLELDIEAVASEGCIIYVRGYTEIPFAGDDVALVSVNHKRWNFRDGSDKSDKARAASA